MTIKSRYTARHKRTLTRIVADFGGRRKLYDRRLPPYAMTTRERRSGVDRRSGFDRRSTVSGRKANRLDRRAILRSQRPPV